MRCERRGRYWAVYDKAGRLVCLAVYRKGAREVVRRLTEGRLRPRPAKPLPSRIAKKG